MRLGPWSVFEPLEQPVEGSYSVCVPLRVDEWQGYVEKGG